MNIVDKLLNENERVPDASLGPKVKALFAKLEAAGFRREPVQFDSLISYEPGFEFSKTIGDKRIEISIQTKSWSDDVKFWISKVGVEKRDGDRVWYSTVEPGSYNNTGREFNSLEAEVNHLLSL